MLHARLRAAAGRGTFDFFDPMDGTGWVGLDGNISVVAGPFDGDAIHATNSGAVSSAYASTGLSGTPSRVTFDFKLSGRGTDDVPFLSFGDTTAQAAGDPFVFTAARQGDASRRPHLIGDTTGIFPSALTVGGEYHFECDISGSTVNARIYNAAMTYDESTTYTLSADSWSYVRLLNQTGDSTGSMTVDNIFITM